MKIGIVGGGIAGLSAAISLGCEHDVTLFERSETIAATGAGIVVSANAGRALRALGVDVEPAGRRVGASTVALADGRPIQVVDLDADGQGVGPTVAVRRSHLHEALIDALPPTVDVRRGCRVDEVVDGGDGAPTQIVVDGEAVVVDLLVGADGIHSQVRASMSDAGRVVPVGVACWRTLLPAATDHEPVEYLGAGQRIGVVGLAAGTYLYLVESAEPGSLGHVDVAGLRERFCAFTAVRSLLEGIEHPPRFDDLAELDRPVWGNERSLLIGDAAHAMTPNLGQGASMAIEDAVVLAQCLRTGQGGWFDTFVAERDPRVRWVQTTSRRLGRLLHARSAPARTLRNAIVGHIPEVVTARQTRRLLAGGPVPPNVSDPWFRTI